MFKGTDRVVFLDKREYGGPIYEQIEEAYQFVLKHINLRMEIDGIYCKKIYEIPPSVLREAIANAVTHRNYMDNACVQVCVYDDRVEIISPGMLFGGLTIDMIKNGSTRIWNAGIAEVFGRMYVIEVWGTGIKRMIGACREYGLPDPMFTELGTNFRVEFFRKNVAGVGVKLSATQKKIVDAMYHDPQITNVKLAEILGVTPRTIERNKYVEKEEYY